MKTITVTFESAKIPLELGKESTDVTNEFGYRKEGKRTNFASIKDNPIRITYKQISNVLHVLCGCRPVPSYRKSFLKSVPVIDEIAKTAYIKFANSTTYTTKDGETKYCIEFTEGKKLPWDSHAKIKTYNKDKTICVNGYITWSLLYKRYGIYRKESYDELLRLFAKTYGDTIENIKKKYSLLDFLIELSKDIYDKAELVDYFNSFKCTAMVNILNSKGDEKVIRTSNFSVFNTNQADNLAALCINTNPTYKICLSGEVCLFIDDQDEKQRDVLYEMLNGTHYATFLDGGYVHNLRCDNYEISDYELLNDGFIKIEK